MPTTGLDALTAQTAATKPRTSTSASSSTGGQEIAGNFTQFLQLLTTQLKNQSPLDPLDTNQFTQQLVQFASVEQQLKTNDTLTTISNGAKASSAASAAGLVGATITADGSSSTLTGGSAKWTISPAKAVAAATINIVDSTGKIIATQTRALSAGSQTYSWDGRTANGKTAAAGTYKIGISARDASGQPVAVSTTATGQVTSVDMTGDAPVLLLGTQRVPLSGVQSIGG